MKKEVLNEGPWLLTCCCPVIVREGESGSVSERVLTESERVRETLRERDGDSVSEDSERGALTAATRQHCGLLGQLG